MWILVKYIEVSLSIATFASGYHSSVIFLFEYTPQIHVDVCSDELSDNRFSFFRWWSRFHWSDYQSVPCDVTGRAVSRQYLSEVSTVHDLTRYDLASWRCTPSKKWGCLDVNCKLSRRFYEREWHKFADRCCFWVSGLALVVVLYAT